MNASGASILRYSQMIQKYRVKKFKNWIEIQGTECGNFIRFRKWQISMPNVAICNYNLF